MFEAIIGIMTILGGLAALWYFRDKLANWWKLRTQGPAAPEIVEKWVDIRYPSDSGLEARLETEGYRVRWCFDKHLARKQDIEGWEIVVEPSDNGIPYMFRLKDRPDDQILIKKRHA